MADVSAFAGCPPVTPTLPQQAVASAVGMLSIVSVTAWRGRIPALAAALHAGFGLDLAAAGRWTGSDVLACIWSAPGHWHIQRQGCGRLADDLAAALGAEAGQIDVSDARAALRISGPGAPAMLARLLPIDLHPRAFAPQLAAATLAGHISVQLRQIDAAPSYEIACSRSYAASLWQALATAGAGALRLA